MNNKEAIIQKCRVLLKAFKTNKLGQTKMPEDSNPGFSENEQELRLAYFTLPMSLNYQRDSYSLWTSALKTYQDEETKKVFDISEVSRMDFNLLREYLLKYKLALQPNKHTLNWQTISMTIKSNFGSFTNLFSEVDEDYIKLKNLIQVYHRKGFPYLAGPKIFNYWSFIIKEYGKVNLKNSKFIEIAPDTHITKCSVILGVITEEESRSLSKKDISDRWRDLLKNSDINPIDMHAPLWFWSRNGFLLEI